MHLGRGVLRFQRRHHAAAPVNLGHHDHDLRRLVQHPLGARFAQVRDVRLLALLLQREDHGGLDGAQPLLDVASGL